MPTAACHGTTVRYACQAGVGARPNARVGSWMRRMSIQKVLVATSSAISCSTLSVVSRARETLMRPSASMSSTLRTIALPWAGTGLASVWISAIRSARL